MAKSLAKYKKVIATIVALLLAALGTAGVVTIVNNQHGSTEIKTETVIPPEIEYADEQVQAIVEESGQGAIETNEIPTVEAVDSNGPVTEVNNESCPEGEECGRGAYVPTLDISSPEAFTNEVLGKCIDVDEYYGSQCWDLMAVFWLNYTGRTLTTCGTGAAKGVIADGCWQQNAGDEFTMIWDPTELQNGDIPVYSTGTWGHIGMAKGPYNNGYTALLGQNQGGAACPGGGAAGNIINLSTRDFIGAFRPNIYIKPAPTPLPISNCITWHVLRGDTMSKIMLECEGTVVYGEAMDAYAKTWYSLVYKPGQSVYEGWVSDSGVGLYENDDIEHRI